MTSKLLLRSYLASVPLRKVDGISKLALDTYTCFVAQTSSQSHEKIARYVVDFSCFEIDLVLENLSNLVT